MAHSNNWDETNPSDSTDADTEAAEICKLRLDVRERLAVDHDFASSDDGSGEEGQHKKVTLRAAIASPTLTGDKTCLYHKTSDLDGILRHKGIDAVDHQPWPGPGSVKMGVLSTAPDGWLNLHGDTIGDASSGATHAATIYHDLYVYLWDHLTNTEAPVDGGRGASGEADWTAHKKMTIPDARGRMPVGAGQGSGLTNRVLGGGGGNEQLVMTHSHTLSSHTHTVSPEYSHTHEKVSGGSIWKSDGEGTSTEGSHAHTAGNASGSTSDNPTVEIMNPWVGFYFYIKI